MSAIPDQRVLFDNMLDGYAYCRMVYKDGEPEDFLYLDVNEAFERLTGLHGVGGKLVSQVIPGIKKSDPQLFEIYGRVAQSGKPERFEMYIEALKIWFIVSVYSPEPGFFIAQFDNITERRRVQNEQEKSIELLRSLNTAPDLLTLIKEAVGFFQRLSGCDSVGIRLRDGEDFPYFETSGFSQEFVRKESSLCTRDELGQVIRDPQGLPLYECMCGNILCGRFDADKTFFTKKGAFWSPHTTQLLASTTDQERMARTRNHCNAVGYESVALVPLRVGGDIIGLLQLNDHKVGQFNAEQIDFYERLTVYLAASVSHRLAQSGLEESENRYRRLVDNLNDMVSEVDSRAVYTYVSPKCRDLLGYEPEELIGQSFAAIAHREESGALKAKFEKLLVDHEPVSVVRRLASKNGTWRWFESTASYAENRLGIPRIVVISRDITDRLEGEHRLTDEKNRLFAILESLSDGVVSADIQGRIGVLNPAAERICGWSQGQARGASLGEVLRLYDFETGKAMDGVFEAVLVRGDTVRNQVPLNLRNRQDGLVLVEITASPLQDYQGKVSGLVMVIRDVTERQRFTETMVKAQRLESLGVLAGGIAHDFNNLLSGIFSFMELSQISLKDGKVEPALASLAKAQSVFERTRALTRQLLTFAKGGEPVRRPLALNPLVQNSSRFALSGTSVDAQFLLADDLCDCDCDENQVGQVIDNLVINAVQAMPNGGRLTVSTRNVRKTPPRSESGENAYAEVCIADTGCGIPKAVVEKIFDPFFTTKAQGNGLGLATVHSIMIKHGGWVEVESEPDQGTTFRLYFPVSVSAARAKTAKTGGASRWQTGGCILVMDDEDYMREIYGELLEPLGFRTVLADSGEKALELFRGAEASGSGFTAAILDLTVPGGRGGADLLEELRGLNPEVLLVAASGYTEDPIMARPGDYGFDDAIAKPFGMEQIMELVIRLSRKLQSKDSR